VYKRQIFVRWAVSGFGELNEIRVGIAALTVAIVGTQMVAGSFLYAFFLPAHFGGGVAPTPLTETPAAPLTTVGRAGSVTTE